jgi:hypothetical protein
MMNFFPALALVKLKCASSRFGPRIVKSCAWMMFAVFATSLANTDVTVPVAPPGIGPNVKHAPVISRSCNVPHGPDDGVTDNTTGALVPSANEHTDTRVNGPNTLLSPAENVVVTVTVAGPPQHTPGNALVELGPNVALTGTVALTRLQLTGVTDVNAIVASGIPSPFVSHASVAAVVTVLPGLCSGIPVSDEKP